MERWLPVVGFEDSYEVSDHGNVRSVPREVVVVSRAGNPFIRKLTGKLLSPSKAGPGEHLSVVLSRKGEYHSVRVHHLVLEAFVGPQPTGALGLHRDDDPRNNHVSNLRWGTHSDNQHDKVLNGNHHNANKTHCPNGHPYTHRVRGARRCRTCRREQSLRWYHKTKADNG